MTESEPARSGPDAAAAGAPAGDEGLAEGDALAAKLLAAQRSLCALDADSDVRRKLHVRLLAICTSLKMPAADRVRGAERLERLMADAERARARERGSEGDQR